MEIFDDIKIWLDGWRMSIALFFTPFPLLTTKKINEVVFLLPHLLLVVFLCFNKVCCKDFNRKTFTVFIVVRFSFHFRGNNFVATKC